MEKSNFPENLEYSCSKFYVKESMAKAWYEANKELGLKNTLLICKDGHMAEYIDTPEGEKFHEKVKNMTEEKFSEICDAFYKALKKESLKTIFKCLAVFTEMDDYNLGTEDMQKQLLRLKNAPTKRFINTMEKAPKNSLFTKAKFSI